MKVKPNRIFYQLLAIILVLIFILPSPFFSQRAYASHFVPSRNITTYGRYFLNRSEGQQWFINEVERLLNLQRRSINTITSAADLNDIYTLNLPNRGISGRIPDAIGDLSNLRHIFLSGNQLTNHSSNNAFPEQMYALQHLETIDVSRNNFIGPIPARLSVLPSLKILLLWDNGFSGRIPPELGEMDALENLDISYNQLTGSIPPQLGNLTSLLLLSASNNRLSGSIPAQLSGCNRLRALILWNNDLSGYIPPALSGLSELLILDVAMNRLTGSLPPNLPVSLREISVADNNLTGVIPATYADLINLEVFDMRNNGLTGNLVDFSDATNLRVYDIANNTFTGVIPDDMFELMNGLEVLHMQNNRLVGHVPDSVLWHQNNNASVNLSQNYMTGDILRQITHNGDNFTDGAISFQNRMSMRHLAISPGQEVNVYALFDTRDARNLNIATAKPKLLPEDYILRLGPGMTTGRIQALLDALEVNDIDEIFELRTDANGIFIKMLLALPPGMFIEFELKIRHNHDSAFSRTLFMVGSTVHPGGPTAPIDPGNPVDPTDPGGGTPGGGGAGGVGIFSNRNPDSLPDSADPLPTNESLVTESTTVVLDRTRTDGYILGYPDGTFKPQNSITRYEAAVIFYRLMSESDRQRFAENPQLLSDVPDGQWFTRAVGVLLAAEVLTGYPDGTFRGDNPITRAEFVTMVSRFWGLNAEGEMSFSDVSAGHWAYHFILSAYSSGWVYGYPDGTFGIDRNITRAETVTMVNRMLEWESGMLTDNIQREFSDVSGDEWYYDAVMLAANGIR